MIPSLSLVPRSDMSQDEVIESLSMKIRKACREQYSGVNDVDQPTIIRTLKRYSPLTRKRLYGFLDSPTLDRAGSDASTTAHSVAGGEDENFISDLMNFLSVQGKSSLIRSLRHYPQFSDLPVDTIDPDSDTYRKVATLMDMSDFIRRTYEANWSPDQGEPPYERVKVPGKADFVVLDDDRLVDFILNQPEKMIRVREIILEHKATDYEVITDALKIGSALGEGTL